MYLFVPYFKALNGNRLYCFERQDGSEKSIGSRDVEGTCGVIKVCLLLLHFHERTEQNHANLYQDSQCYHIDSQEHFQNKS
jgi:hypothetical protein